MVSEVSLHELADTIESSTGLDFLSSQTLVNYAILTHELRSLSTIPIIIIQGDFETGKTTILTIMSDICEAAVLFTGQDSNAQQRDSMKENTTVLIDEADFSNENILLSRYSRQTSKMNVKRSLQNGAWITEPMNLFGATILHRRTPLKDAAVLSRSIVLHTKPKNPSQVRPYKPSSSTPFYKVILEASRRLSLSSIESIPAGRANLNWGLLKLAHNAYMQDIDWLDYADAQIENSQQLSTLGRELEPKSALWSAVATLALMSAGELQIKVAKEKVLLSEVRTELSKEGIEFNSWQTSQIAREVGFEIKRTGGQIWIYTGLTPGLKLLGQGLGIEDSWLNS